MAIILIVRYKVVGFGSQEPEVRSQETMPNPVILHTYEKRYNSKTIFKVKSKKRGWEWGDGEKKAENSHLITEKADC